MAGELAAGDVASGEALSFDAGPDAEGPADVDGFAPAAVGPDATWLGTGAGVAVTALSARGHNSHTTSAATTTTPAAINARRRQ